MKLLMSIVVAAFVLGFGLSTLIFSTQTTRAQQQTKEAISIVNRTLAVAKKWENLYREIHEVCRRKP